jgi:hypothetical protein
MNQTTTVCPELDTPTRKPKRSQYREVWTVSAWECQWTCEVTPELQDFLRSNDAWGTLLNQPHFIARRAQWESPEMTEVERSRIPQEC